MGLDSQLLTCRAETLLFKPSVYTGSVVVGRYWAIRNVSAHTGSKTVGQYPLSVFLRVLWHVCTEYCRLIIVTECVVMILLVNNVNAIVTTQARCSFSISIQFSRDGKPVWLFSNHDIPYNGLIYVSLKWDVTISPAISWEVYNSLGLKLSNHKWSFLADRSACLSLLAIKRQMLCQSWVLIRPLHRHWAMRAFWQL